MVTDVFDSEYWLLLPLMEGTLAETGGGKELEGLTTIETAAT